MTGPLKPGVYRILWKTGTSSVAAVGVCTDGSRWIAPTNWVAPVAGFNDWHLIEKATLLATQEKSVIETAEVIVPTVAKSVTWGEAMGCGPGMYTTTSGFDANQLQAQIDKMKKSFEQFGQNPNSPTLPITAEAGPPSKWGKSGKWSAYYKSTSYGTATGYYSAAKSKPNAAALATTDPPLTPAKLAPYHPSREEE